MPVSSRTGAPPTNARAGSARAIRQATLVCRSAAGCRSWSGFLSFRDQHLDPFPHSTGTSLTPGRLCVSRPSLVDDVIPGPPRDRRTQCVVQVCIPRLHHEPVLGHTRLLSVSEYGGDRGQLPSARLLL